MKKYLHLQLKRAGRLFPFVLAVTLALLGSVVFILGAILSAEGGKEENTKAVVGVAGDMENSFLKLGLGAMQTFDDTRYSMELKPFEEKAAAAALKNGTISAYIVIPEDFIEKAFSGDIEPIRFVTTAHTSDVVTMLKNEILTVITDMVVASQKGTYGTDDLMESCGNSAAGEDMDRISLDYFELIVNRNDMLTVEEVGVKAQLSTTNYYICSMFIFFFMLLGLPFASIYCRGENTLCLLLRAKGVSVFKLKLAEYLSHLASLVAITFILLGGAALADIFLKADLLGSLEFCPFIYLLPTLMMLAAFNLLLFELASNIINGVLIHFFTALSISYISGCFFPIHTFPKAVQALSSFLPVGVAREHLSGLFTGEGSLTALLTTLGYAILFFLVSLGVRQYKLSRGGTA